MCGIWPSNVGVRDAGGFFNCSVAGQQEVGVVFRVWVNVRDVGLVSEFCVCRVAVWKLRMKVGRCAE